MSFAQSDSTKSRVVDIIYLQKGGVIWGEILSFNEESGGLVVKDQGGKKYFLAKEDYKYFVEDHVIAAKQKKKRDILPRKTEELEFSIGLSAGNVNHNQRLITDDYFLQAFTTVQNIPMCFNASVGKYFTRRHYIGATTELAFASYGTRYFNFGVRYAHQYDGFKNNVGLYLPIELVFNTQNLPEINYEVNDSVLLSGTYFSPTTGTTDISMNSMVLSLGQGIAFHMNNKKSISFEFSLQKYFVMNHRFYNQVTLKQDPSIELNPSGFKLLLRYNL